MNPRTERRALQGATALACLVPLLAGGAGAIEGAAMVKGIGEGAPPDLDSHMRYLSGLLFGIGILFAAAIPRVERAGALFRTLGLLVFVGGLARLYGLMAGETPGPGHLFGLAMELLVTPALVLWQARVERLFAASAASDVE